MRKVEAEHVFAEFARCENLTAVQIDAFKQYAHMLVDWNTRMNLTAITESSEIVWYHFQDSIILDKFLDMPMQKSIVDVGSGAGFPGIPLKIKYPHLQVFLIEVLEKRVTFLREVIKQLMLDYIEVIPLDWRTFLRTTSYNVDVICARASLSPHELLRMFRSGCGYNKSLLAYWASAKYMPSAQEKNYIYDTFSYAVGEKTRQLIFFKAQGEGKE